jgi:cytochrome c peroxidase
MKKFLAALAMIAFSTSVLATMELQKDLVAKYPTCKANCATCHVKKMAKKGDAELNVFGKDMVAKAIVDPKAEKKTYDYKKIEALDSDKDGKTNLEELKAGTNPGDPASK